jgi:hypothetical protein
MISKGRVRPEPTRLWNQPIRRFSRRADRGAKEAETRIAESGIIFLILPFLILTFLTQPVTAHELLAHFGLKRGI